MSVLVTGAAGFLGMHVAQALLRRGDQVIGLDDLNAGYNPALKQARLHELERHDGFSFVRADVTDAEAVSALLRRHAEDITEIVHLAAPASFHQDLEGRLVLLEAARQHLPRLRHHLYVEPEQGQPGPALVARAYGRLYGLPSTGLRLGSVYGPWGRPGDPYYAMADALAAGRPVTLFGDAGPGRDMTYVEDIATGVLTALARPPGDAGCHRTLDLGRGELSTTEQCLAALEAAMGARPTAAPTRHPRPSPTRCRPTPSPPPKSSAGALRLPSRTA